MNPDVTPSEIARRQAVLIHIALVASIGAYAVMLLFMPSETLTAEARTPPPRLFFALAAIGVAQFAAASWIGRSLLGSRRSGAIERVRLYFLLRGAAAEAIAIFGLVAGIRGSPPTHVAALFVISAAAMFSCAPTRAAWEEASRRSRETGHGRAEDEQS